MRRNARQRWLDRHFPKPTPDLNEARKQAQQQAHSQGQMQIFDQLPLCDREAVRDGASFIEAYMRLMAGRR